MGCCGDLIDTCGVEPFCGGWACIATRCEVEFDPPSTDVEGECLEECCDGNGSCARC
jgi:hypothetical protein